MGICQCKSSYNMDHGLTEVQLHSAPTDLCKPIIKNGRFDNPFDTWIFPKLGDLLQFVFREKNNLKLPKAEELEELLPVKRPDADKLKNSESGKVQCTWIGHASCLVQMDGVNFLTDPIFSNRCAPTQMFGPKRFRPPALTVNDLPDIHAVVISHTHYDHLDHGSVKDLQRKFGEKIHWLVPKGLLPWMTSVGCKNVSELTWWEGQELGDTGVNFVFTPAQHWCKRNATDTNKVLWGSWTVVGPTRRFYFAGDTGYCSAFQQIGEQHGPFDLAAIPIGAYCPRWFMKPQHVDPAEAVKMHVDIKSKHSFGIHWGTFPLSNEPLMEPKEQLEREMIDAQLDPGSFRTYHLGQTFAV